MKRECPVTGEPARVSQAADLVTVEHPKLGRFVLHSNALPPLETDAGARERMARWISESRSLGLELPSLTAEHVHLFQRLAELEETVSEWHELRQTMKEADEERLWMKLRLEWNYNSNHIEGNTLTYHETELLLIHGRTAGGHPMRDYEEMKAHDVAIDHTRSLAGAEQVIGEGDIRDLNQILLKEPFWQSAETPDGQPTRKRIEPGQYKRQPNHVRTATGELHRFAEPEETPARMEEWTRDFRRDLERTAHPLPLLLAESHWSFLRIHPFDDGNGRTARLLANYALLRKDLPPMVIKSEDRDRYIGALQNADLGSMLPLAQFMLGNVLWSLGLGIQAAKGESIAERGDTAKDLELFVQSRRGPEPRRSDLEVLDSVFQLHLRPTLDRLEEVLHRLSELFRARHLVSWIEQFHRIGGSLFAGEQWEQTKQQHTMGRGFKLSDERQVQLREDFIFEDYTGRGDSSFGLRLSVIWRLGGDGFTFEAAIDEQPLAEIGRRIPYSELDDRDPELDHTMDRLYKALKNEIVSRSGGSQRE